MTNQVLFNIVLILFLDLNWSALSALAFVHPTLTPSNLPTVRHWHAIKVSTTPPHNDDQQSQMLQAFEQDVTTILKDLRGADLDPTLPKPFNRDSKRPSFTRTWTLQDWERHTSRLRYWDYLRTLPHSRLLRRILPHLLLMLAWSCGVVAVFSLPFGSELLSRMALNLTPLSLVSSFVFALETLRSNQGLSRLNEGRLTFGKVLLYTRDMAQLIQVCIVPRNAKLGLKLARHVVLFSWLLKKLLRGDTINGNDEDIIRTMLSAKDANYILRQRKAPLAVVMRLRQVIAHMGQQKQLSTAEELAMDHVAQELNHCVTTAERIIGTPIPVLYTAHLGRLLIFYLLLLPLALQGSNILNGWTTVFLTTAVSYAVLGLDEISHLLEQPFKYMPLYQLSKESMRDVADVFLYHPPALDDDDDDNGVDDLTFKPPSYW